MLNRNSSVPVVQQNPLSVGFQINKHRGNRHIPGAEVQETYGSKSALVRNDPTDAVVAFNIVTSKSQKELNWITDCCQHKFARRVSLLLFSADQWGPVLEELCGRKNNPPVFWTQTLSYEGPETAQLHNLERSNFTHTASGNTKT